MRGESILKKTLAGQLELEQRLHAMPWRQRALFVAIDGFHTTQELRTRFAAQEGDDTLLDDLIARGLVTAVQADEPAHPTLSANESLRLARELMLKGATHMGLISGMLFGRSLRFALTADELNDLLPEFQRRLTEVSNQESAHAMTQRISGLLEVARGQYTARHAA